MLATETFRLFPAQYLYFASILPESVIIFVKGCFSYDSKRYAIILTIVVNLKK